MKKLQLFSIAGLLAISTITLQAQTWTVNAPNLYLNPTTARVGIGTVSPTQALTVKGRMSMYPDGVVPDEAYKGNLIITKPANSGQYINLVRQNCYPWSIGTVYNSNTFAIGKGYSNDEQFTNPFFIIDTSGNVGIGTTTPQRKLHIEGDVFIPVGSYRIGSHNDSGNRLRLHHNTQNAYIDYAPNLYFRAGTSTMVTFDSNGNVGIGLTNPSAKLDVAGVIRAHEVKVCVNQGCDYVFADDYKLMSLNDLSSFVKTNKHLPEVAPAAIMEAEGISLSEMNTLLLKKVEELTLYVIGQNEKMQILEAEINELKNK